MAKTGNGTIEIDPRESNNFITSDDGTIEYSAKNLDKKIFNPREKMERVNFSSNDEIIKMKKFDSLFENGIPIQDKKVVDSMFAGGYENTAEGKTFNYGPINGHNLSNGHDIMISYEKINETIATLKKAIANLENSYSGIESDLKKISSKWLGKDALAFTTSGKEVNEKVALVIKALTLLATTYHKAADVIQEKQNSTKQIIDNLN